MLRPFFALAILALTPCGWAANTARVYPFPAGEPASKRFAVTVNGEVSGVYIAHVLTVGTVGTATTKEQLVDGEASFTSFDIMGKAHLAVTSPDIITSVKLLPSNRAVVLHVKDREVTFDLDTPGQYTVEINGDWNNSLNIFANAPETGIPSPDDPNVIYFGPGVHSIDPLVVTSGKTVYLAPGAVVYAKAKPCAVVFQLEGDNITVRGRGIIDDSLSPRVPCGGTYIMSHVMTAHGNNLKVEGVTMRDSAGWTFPVHASNHVTIDNIKIFGWRGNSDGIDIDNSQDVQISHGFIRTYDDLVVLKATTKGAPPTRDITVKNMVLWNPLAHALSLGAEIRENIENVNFTDCDVIHDKGREWTFRVYDTDSGTVRHIVFDNIRVEETQRLTSIWIGKTRWSRDDDRGHVEDVEFRNIRSAAGARPTTQNDIVGLDAQHAVHHVVYKNVTVGGKRLKSDDVKFNAFAYDIKVTR
jgi:hypothetical protein